MSRHDTQQNLSRYLRWDTAHARGHSSPTADPQRGDRELSCGASDRASSGILKQASHHSRSNQITLQAHRSLIQCPSHERLHQYLGRSLIAVAAFVPARVLISANATAVLPSRIIVRVICGCVVSDAPYAARGA